LKIENIPVVILAGGKGKRLSGIVSDKPKVMCDVRGKPFLSYILYWLKNYGIINIFLSVGFMQHEIISYYQSGETFGLKIRYLKEGSPLGTGGAVAKALKEIESEMILFLNGDTFLDIDLDSFISDHYERMPYMTIVCIKKKKPDRYGSLVFNNEKRIISFMEKDSADIEWINGGMYLITNIPSDLQFDRTPISFEKELIPKMVKNVIVNAFPQDNVQFIDIGTPCSLVEAQTYMKGYKAI
tara:strand:+ start:87 stop:809 length:723 start_codon:yes stop_codon:yes gene_type:complete